MTAATGGNRKRLRVLVAADEERNLEGVMADLRHAGLPPDAEVTVLTVADLLPVAAGSPAATAL
ncbi:MAG: hypothetical protein ACRERC_04650, partial [Candidatus Binatia bacterium]